jgi:uncharacterized protein (TIGR02001 family)
MMSHKPDNIAISSIAFVVAETAVDQDATRAEPGHRWLFVAGLLACLCLVPSSPEAEDFSALVMFASNYFYRGYSKSGNDPTVRGNADYEFRFGEDRAYVGSWLSRIDFEDRGFPDPADVEFYPYVGLNLKLAEDWRFDTSVSRYLFVGKLFGQDSDYNEYSASLHYRDLLSARVDFADNLYNRNHTSMNYEVSGRYPITDSIQLAAGFGYFSGKPAVEYDALYWNLGVSWFFPYGAVDLRYVDFAHSAPTQNPNAVIVPSLNNNFVFSLTAGF